MKLRRTGLVALVVVGVASLAQAPAADAGGSSGTPDVTTINTTVVAPFQLSWSNGTLYVADGGTSRVSLLRSSSLNTIAMRPAAGTGDVAGLDVVSRGRLWAFTQTDYKTGAALLRIVQGGAIVRTVDLSAYERTHNPDQTASYGIDHPSPCVIAAFKKAGAGPASYKGQVDSHPYAVLRWGDGWVVADAGGNDLLRVDGSGNVSTLAVLPPQPLTLTRAMTDSQHLAPCVAGNTYKFEPVPTDVVAHDGGLWVTTLPGGPEDASFGARGSVYAVNPDSGASHRVATGFSGATNLAVNDDGKVYVAELFGNKVSTVRDGRPHPWVSLKGALSLVWGDGALYAGTLAPLDSKGNPTGHGSLVRITR